MKNNNSKYVICVKNDDCDDLEVRKIYRVIPDDDASKNGYLRIIDETGDDYLYPESYFLIVELPHKAQELLFVA